MTKVLHIADSQADDTRHRILTLADNKSEEFDIEVILHKGSSLTPLLKQRGVKYHELPLSMWAIRRKIKELKPDIVHTHGTLSGRIAARLYGRCKIVHTPSSPVTRKMRHRMFCDRIIAVSPSVKNVLQKAGVSERKISLVYDGVSPAWKYSAEQSLNFRRKYNVPQNAFVVTYIAPLSEENHNYVLDTARELPFNVCILIVGTGEYEAHLKNRINKERLANVRMISPLSDLDELLAMANAQMDVSYMPETVSLPLLAGLSVGRPAIVTERAPYVIENGISGLVIPPHDPEVLDDAITRLKDDPKMYKQLSEGAAARYKQFTAAKMTAETESIYNELS